MFGLMQDWPLTVDRIIDHGATWDGDRPVVARGNDGNILRSDYGAIRIRARKLSAALAAIDIKPGDRVATMAWNNIRHLESWFAIMGMGAVCHTLNPRLFADQLRYIIGHAEDRAILVDPCFQTLLADILAGMAWDGIVIVLGDEQEVDRDALPGATSVDTLIASASGDDARWGDFDERAACALCYTSGTTGHPKGVLYSHRSTVIHMLMTLQPDVFGIGINDVAMPIVPMYHANAWGMPLSTAAIGCKLVLPGAQLDGASLHELIEREGVTFSAAVPTVWQGLLHHLDTTGARLTSLRRVIIGGAALPESLIRRLAEHGVAAVQGWGMTETSPIGTHGKLVPAIAALPLDDQMPQRLKQGRPPFGIELKIVDDAGARLPHDGATPGRLHVRGPTVAGAYMGGAIGDILDDEGFFDTGDVATIDRYGYMAIVDRAKDVIKSGGEWISSIEIENIASGHPKVAHCAVIGVPHPRWDERPLLIASLHPGEQADDAELLAVLDGKIAKWWMPDAVAFIGDMPLGATGKIDKKALRARFSNPSQIISKGSSPMALDALDTGFALRLGGQTILSHRAGAPCFSVGRGEPHVHSKLGHFDVSQDVIERIALNHVELAGDVVRFAAAEGTPWLLEATLSGDDDNATIALNALDPALNRLWLRVPAEAGEHVWGGGEQFSYFDLRGRHFPLWSSEPGVGRDPASPLFQQVEAHRKGGGGSYAHTNYPQPTFVSSRRYALHVDSFAYAAFDFRAADFHEVEVWEIPAQIQLWARPRFADLVSALSDRFGRQPPLPEWLLKGAVIGLKDGDNSFARLKSYEDAGVAVSGLWCEDWVGLRITSFGNRLFWDWQWNAERYPELPARIAELKERGIRFLGYVNPYLAVDGPLYAEAAAQRFMVMHPTKDEPYVIDFGEFDCGHVDFTNPAAAAWFADTIIGEKMIDFGLSGWMADFGEYLPVDVRLANGESGMTAHNRWPALWGEVNAKGVAGRGATGETMVFMRSGATGVQGHCPMLWAGDQAVDFSRHDGIGTVICAALSAGMLGNAHHHSDCGGYTSLFDTTRDAELAMRWAEMSAFTSMMRTHEGNRPRQNAQYDDDPELLAHFAKMTRIYAHLAPYLRRLSNEASETGLPVQRPLFLHFEDDAETYAIQTSYLLGPDLLVAPVIAAGKSEWTTYLPAGVDWVHVWSGRGYGGGSDVTVAAPFGQPPVFYRAGSADAALFDGIVAA